MNACLFLSFRLPTGSSVGDETMAKLNAFLRATPLLAQALVHTPARASDPYLDDGPPPQLVLQLYFAELPPLEAALARNGHLAILLSRVEFPELAGADITQQAMLVRTFSVPDPVFRNLSGEPYCTYLVSYEGEAEDLNAWLGHYLGKHIEHVARLPGLRELEVYTRLDWTSGLPFPRVNFMQRNKVAFDSEAALTHALNSPARHKMREDYRGFPAFTGGNTHYAMATRVVQPPVPPPKGEGGRRRRPGGGR
jgi:hypothetical protein